MAAPRAVADTNVLVAAAISPHGLCGRLLGAALDDRWQLVASPLLLTELSSVLAREKFRRWVSADQAGRFVSGISAIADVRGDPPPTPRQVTADPGDEFLVALAQVADVAALVSGDPHLTDLADLEPPVLTPAAFLARLDG